MKKALAVVLSVLVVFSMFSMAVSAATVPVEGAKVTVEFVDLDGKQIALVGYADIKDSEAVDFPEIEDKIERDEKQTDGTTKKYRYTFQGWKSNKDDTKLYYAGTLSKHPSVTGHIVLRAQYAQEDLSGRQSFWQFIESLFARINVLFEYFATIFNF